jgi:hypothetical protein
VIRARPHTVMRAQSTRVEGIVTYEGRVLPRVEVVFGAGDGRFQSSGQAMSKLITTDEDGLARDGWRYDKRELATAGRVLSATVAAHGETARSETRAVVKPGID